MNHLLKKKRYRPNKKGLDYKHDESQSNPIKDNGEVEKKNGKDRDNYKRSNFNEKKMNYSRYTSRILTSDNKLIEDCKEFEAFKATLKKERDNSTNSNNSLYGNGNNIKHYYNRYLEAFKDRTFLLFSEEWIKDKKCLDIGCNDGTLTLIIAISYQPEHIVGIDFDQSLINKAISNRKFVIDCNFPESTAILNYKSSNLTKSNQKKPSQSQSNCEKKNEKEEKADLSMSNNKKDINNNIELQEETKVEIENVNDTKTSHEEYKKSTSHEEYKKPTSDIQENIVKNVIVNKNLEIKSLINKISSMPKSFLTNIKFFDLNSDSAKMEKLLNIKNPQNKKFPQNTSFHTENIIYRIFESECQKKTMNENVISENEKNEINDKKLNCSECTNELYDTIFCLSVTKWIHLKYGDIGLEVLFYIIYKHLKTDGILILEPQEFRSYKKHLKEKRKGNNEVNKYNFKLYPDYFVKYLLNTFGLKLIKEVLPPSNSKSMHQRKIYIFQK